MLKGINIEKKINGNVILKNININIPTSNITSLIGPSGSGKSSILSCLSLLANPSSGQVVVDDKVFNFTTGLEKYKDYPYPKVTVVFQGLFLWPHLTNKENLFLPLKGLNKPLLEFEELVEKLKIKDILNKYPNECSGGEKQRVALIRQILLKPQYLLLDEVTSALDLETVNTVAEILCGLRKKGTGILLVTHMINLAKTISDNFYFVDNGLIVETGNMALLKQPKTERLNRFLQIYN